MGIKQTLKELSPYIKQIWIYKKNDFRLITPLKLKILFPPYTLKIEFNTLVKIPQKYLYYNLITKVNFPLYGMAVSKELIRGFAYENEIKVNIDSERYVIGNTFIFTSFTEPEIKVVSEEELKELKVMWMVDSLEKKEEHQYKGTGGISI